MNIELRPFDPSAEYFFREGCYITELSNTDNDRDVSIARVRVDAGRSTRWHRLDDITERYVILSGSGRVEVSRGRAFDVGAGDVFIIPANEPQRITNTGREDLVFLAVCSPRFQAAAYRDLEGEC